MPDQGECCHIVGPKGSSSCTINYITATGEESICIQKMPKQAPIWAFDCLIIMQTTWVHVVQGRSVDGVSANHNSALQDMLDLRPYVDSSAAAVQESYSVERTYVVFRTLGLRHLVVVDRHNHVKGIVTRKVSTCAAAYRLVLFCFQTGLTFKQAPALACLVEVSSGLSVRAQIACRLAVGLLYGEYISRRSKGPVMR